MTTRLIIVFFIFCCFLPSYAKNSSGGLSSVEQIKQTIFKTVSNQIPVDGFPQVDMHRDENLHALHSWQIVDDRTIIKFDSTHYIVTFNNENNYKTNYIFNNDGTLAYVDFLVYPSYIKSFADLVYWQENDYKIYPYYVYRHDNGGYLNGIWYITKAIAYFFGADKSLRYKCDMLACTDVRTGNSVGSRYY